MKRGYLVLFFVLVFVVIVLNVLNSLLYFQTLAKIGGNVLPLTAQASNTGEITLFVEGPDVLAPNVSVVNPENTTYTSARTRLDYSVSDDLGLGSCWYSLDSGENNVSVTCGENVTGLNSGEGSSTWTVYANDSVGNENSSSVTFSVSVPASSPVSTGGGGGGGAASVPVITDNYRVFPEELNIFVVSGEKQEEEIRVSNTGNVKLTLDIKIQGVEGIIGLDSNQIVLNPGKEKNILLTVSAPGSGVFAGKVILTSQEGEIEEVLILLNVRSEKQLFDVSLTIPESYKTVSSGEFVRSFISLLQIGDAVGLDVTLNYVMKDFDGNVLFSESETLFVYQTKNFVKEFDTADLSAGDYVIGMEVVYPGGFATSSAHFRVEGVFEITKEFYLIGALILLAVIAIVFSILKYKKSSGYSGRKKK